ncbi:MAG: membrane protein insertion efficiency factor YidD [Hyphomicrobiales bacterium]
MTKMIDNLAPQKWPRKFGLALIWVYQKVISPLLGSSCRYAPTCSSYGAECISKFGLWIGGWMTLARFTRCNPLGASGHDPVPNAPNNGGRWYLPWRYGYWTGVHIDPATRLD